MADLTVGRVAELINDVNDAVESILQEALFFDRMAGMDADAVDPRYARYLLALRELGDAFGLTVAPKPAESLKEDK